MLEVEYVPAQTGLELIDFSSMYQVLPLRDLRLLVFALQHIGFNLPIRISEIARCWICHRDIQLASIILHNSLQLSAVIEHVLRIMNMVFKLEQPENIFLISVTAEVLKLETLSSVNLEQL